MANISKIKGIDLDVLSTERLESLLQNELYIDIDSPFADELIAEIYKRKDLIYT